MRLVAREVDHAELLPRLRLRAGRRSRSRCRRGGTRRAPSISNPLDERIRLVEDVRDQAAAIARRRVRRDVRRRSCPSGWSMYDVTTSSAFGTRHFLHRRLHHEDVDALRRRRRGRARAAVPSASRSVAPHLGIVRTRILDEIDRARAAASPRCAGTPPPSSVALKSMRSRTSGGTMRSIALDLDRVEAGRRIGSRPVTRGNRQPVEQRYAPRARAAPSSRRRCSDARVSDVVSPRASIASCSSSGASPSSGHGWTSANPSSTRINAPRRAPARATRAQPPARHELVAQNQITEAASDDEEQAEQPLQRAGQRQAAIELRAAAAQHAPDQHERERQREQRASATIASRIQRDHGHDGERQPARRTTISARAKRLAETHGQRPLVAARDRCRRRAGC